ncbi:MAG: glycosyltransferase family 4 protein, partial [Gammaproteobacteria bacterium]|nr:glycosyltransferase family 4 protein [Gammaproteobacteria bacterium]
MPDTPQRLLVITELFMPTKGGTAVWFDEVYRRLGGKEIHIVTARVPGCEAHDAQHANTVHRLDLKRSPWLRPESLAMYLKLLLKSISLMLTQRIDAVHAGRVLPEGLVGWCVARLFRKPIVIYAHGEEITTWRQSGKFRAMCFAYRHADQVIANSEFTKDELQKIGVSEQRITLINPGVDIARFAPGLPCDDLRAQAGCAAPDKLLLSVGRLSRRKGFDQVIRCLPGLLPEFPNLQYALIGIGEDQAYLEAQARECGVEAHVHLLGHVSVADLPRWYNAADVFVLPNREIDGDTEGFGMVFVEASACGVPVVAGQAGGTASSVNEGVSGYRVDGNSLEDVTNTLRHLLEDPRWRREWASR